MSARSLSAGLMLAQSGTAAVPFGPSDIIAQRLTGEEEAYNNSMHSLRLSV